MNQYGCTNCGKCCDFTTNAPFITAADMRAWYEKGLYHVIRKVCFTVSMIQREKGKTEENLEQQWTFRTVSRDDKTCCFRDTTRDRCRIYKVRPLACQTYPANGVCHEGKLHRPNIAILRQHIKADKEWKQATVEWRQEKLKALHDECENMGIPLQ